MNYKASDAINRVKVKLNILQALKNLFISRPPLIDITLTIHDEITIAKEYLEKSIKTNKLKQTNITRFASLIIIITIIFIMFYLLEFGFKTTNLISEIFYT